MALSNFWLMRNSCRYSPEPNLFFFYAGEEDEGAPIMRAFVPWHISSGRCLGHACAEAIQFKARARLSCALNPGEAASGDETISSRRPRCHRARKGGRGLRRL